MSNTSLLGSYGDNSGAGLMFRNRIINGDMRIDQRNAGAAVTVNSTADFFSADRWAASGQSADGVFTVQQSSIAPAGFSKSLLCTVTTADLTVGGTQRYFVEQKIEGFNIADFAWGTASAQSVSLSFWVRSSVTGSLGGTISNGASRYFPFSYSISAANTWEYKTITIPGETSGSWSSTNTLGLEVLFSLGTGYTAAANTWSNTTALAPIGSVNVISTNGATLYITGVQLEAGPTATPFERRPIGVELQMCQRYLPVINYNTNGGDRFAGCSVNTTNSNCTISFMVQPRTAPTGITVSAANHWSWSNRRIGAGGVGTAITFQSAGLSTAEIQITTTVGSPTLAAGDFGVLYPSNASAFILFTGCEL